MTQDDILRTIAGTVRALRAAGAYEDDPLWEAVDKLIADEAEAWLARQTVVYKP